MFYHLQGKDWRTTARMQEVESRREQRPRATHDCMDAGGRTASGTAVEEYDYR
jgi:hypothetical protein